MSEIRLKVEGAALVYVTDSGVVHVLDRSASVIDSTTDTTLSERDRVILHALMRLVEKSQFPLLERRL